MISPVGRDFLILFLFDILRYMSILFNISDKFWAQCLTKLLGRSMTACPEQQQKIVGIEARFFANEVGIVMFQGYARNDKTSLIAL